MSGIDHVGRWERRKVVNSSCEWRNSDAYFGAGTEIKVWSYLLGDQWPEDLNQR